MHSKSSSYCLHRNKPVGNSVGVSLGKSVLYSVEKAVGRSVGCSIGCSVKNSDGCSVLPGEEIAVASGVDPTGICGVGNEVTNAMYVK